ncbi:MAG: prepilin-type N-terminal cleavage/methylation domain-containing protein [Gallionella sp.]
MLNKRPHKGLTLIELLVAISVLAVVAVLGWRGLDSIVRSRIALTDDLAQTRGMQLTFAQLQSDCAHLANPSELVSQVSLAAAQGRLTLVRTVFSEDHPSRLQVVTYQIKDNLLTRRESVATRDLRELDKLWLRAVNDTDTNTGTTPLDSLRTGVVLQSDVTAMTMRLWVNGSNGWSATSVQSPLPLLGTPVNPSNPSQPTGLEVTIQVHGRATGMVKVFLLGAV